MRNSPLITFLSAAYFAGVGAGATGAGAGLEAGIAGAGATGVAAGLDDFENCCNTELPVETPTEF